MTPELAKQLKDAGFPFIELATKAVNGRPSCLFCGQSFIEIDKTWFMNPTLSELIEACGERFGSLQLAVSKDPDNHRYWRAVELGNTGGELGSTPDEAVAKLWLALKGIPNGERVVQ